jgi:DNA sulfur modification protein DndD
MEFDILKIKNFRQYYSGQSVEFSQDDEENVTVIHGANGAGKSALRNTFLWLFYNEVDLPQPKHIANERAMAQADVGDRIRVEVELEFDHEERHYWTERWAEYEKQANDDLDGELVDEGAHVQYRDVDGKTVTPENPNTSLERFIPERLSHLFFFHGEEIDQLSREDNKNKIRDAIRNLMGLEILERSIRHLEWVQKNEFGEEMEEYGSEELTEYIASLDGKQEKLAEREDRKEDIQQSVVETKSELESVKQRLRELEGTRELQQERDDLEEREEQLRDEIDEINDSIRETCSEDGYLVFSMPAVQKTAEALEEKRKKGEIPSEIKERFVDDRLEMGVCICGRDLDVSTEPYQNVKNWKKKAGTNDLDQAATNITSRLRGIAGSRSELFDEIEGDLGERRERLDEINEIAERLDEISEQISEKEKEDVKELERRRGTLEERITNLNQDKKRVENEIDRIEDQISEIESNIEEAREEEEKSKKARRRYLAAQRAREELEAKFESYQDQVREQVDKKVKDIFGEIISKNYWTEIGEDYSLDVFKEVGGRSELVSAVPTSTGERQVASLAFIGALTYLTREQYRSNQDNVYFQGGVYPMVMDAPFGYLGTEYQRGVSQQIPTLADQVVVLVTEPQWEAEVKEHLERTAGKQYYLEYHDPDEEEEIEYEYTEIRVEE